MKNCKRCGNEIKAEPGSCGTGYALIKKGGKNVRVCYACCTEIDKKNMARTGRYMLYLVKRQAAGGYCSLENKNDHIQRTPVARYREGNSYAYFVTNWPASLEIPCRVSEGKHNIAGKRYDCWFYFEGYEWHGVSYGDNSEICYVRRTKRKSPAPAYQPL